MMTVAVCIAHLHCLLITLVTNFHKHSRPTTSMKKLIIQWSSLVTFSYTEDWFDQIWPDLKQWHTRQFICSAFNKNISWINMLNELTCIDPGHLILIRQQWNQMYWPLPFTTENPFWNSFWNCAPIRNNYLLHHMLHIHADYAIKFANALLDEILKARISLRDSVMGVNVKQRIHPWLLYFFLL